MPVPQTLTDEDAAIRAALQAARLEALGRVRKHQSRRANAGRPAADVLDIPTETP
jgi:hypothetical protein